MIVIVLTHIVVALAGLVASTAAFIMPSVRKINLTFGLIAGTIASGTILVLITRTSIMHACISGLVYVGLASSGALLARRKLAGAVISRR